MNNPLIEQLVDEVKDLSKPKWKQYSEEKPDINRTIIILYKDGTYFEARKRWQMTSCIYGFSGDFGKDCWKDIFDEGERIFEYWMYPPEYPNVE